MLAGVIVTAAGIGIYSTTASAFIIPVCESLGFSRGEYTLHRTWITIVSALVLPLYGRLYERFGAKKIMLSSIFGYIIVCLGYSISSQIWHFYLFAIINGIFCNGFNFMLLGSLVNEWFEDKKALATSIAYCGSGLGGSVALPIAGQLIEIFGWRWTYRILCMAGTAILLPTVLLLVVDKPAMIGLTPYQDSQGRQEKVKKHIGHVAEMTLTEAKKTKYFWLMGIAFFTTSLCAVGPNTHTLPYLQDIGYASEQASLIMSFAMIMLTVGKIILGGVYDRFGTFVGNLFVGGSCLLAPLLAMASGYPAAAWAFAVTLGFETSGYSVPVSTLITKYFGGKDFSRIFSVCTVLTTVGGAFSVPAMGWLYDYFGNYDLAWMLLLALGGISLLSFFCCDLLHAKQEKREQTCATK